MRRPVVALLVVAVGVAGCGGGPVAPSPSLPPATDPAPTPIPTRSPAPRPPTEPPPPSAALLGSPPIARLAVEGGDPVEGQLGTYTWAGGGSDSPWLPGAPIAAGAGEPMSIAFEPVLGVTAWRARLVPAAADGPAGARLLAEGSAPPRFEAPEPGAWTLVVEVTFAADLGAASYAWALSVS